MSHIMPIVFIFFPGVPQANNKFLHIPILPPKLRFLHMNGTIGAMTPEPDKITTPCGQVVNPKQTICTGHSDSQAPVEVRPERGQDLKVPHYKLQVGTNLSAECAACQICVSKSNSKFRPS